MAKEKIEDKLAKAAEAARGKREQEKEIERYQPKIEPPDPRDVNKMDDLVPMAFEAVIRALTSPTISESARLKGGIELLQMAGLSAAKKHIHLGLTGELPPEVQEALFGVREKPKEVKIDAEKEKRSSN